MMPGEAVGRSEVVPGTDHVEAVLEIDQPRTDLGHEILECLDPRAAPDRKLCNDSRSANLIDHAWFQPSPADLEPMLDQRATSTAGRAPRGRRPCPVFASHE